MNHSSNWKEAINRRVRSENERHCETHCQICLIEKFAQEWIVELELDMDALKKRVRELELKLERFSDINGDAL